MRYSTEDQMQKILQRKEEYLRRRSRHISDSLAIAAVCLIAGSSAVLSFFSDLNVSNVADSAYGAFLLSSRSGSYVLCGVIAFVCGCVVTLLCIRGRQRQIAKNMEEIERSNTL